MPRDYGEQVVVITGASSGIGRATALEFARQGAAVVLAARNDIALKEVVAQIRDKGGQAQVVVTDVAEWPQVERLAASAIKEFGRIDTWVNNAAVSEYALFEDMAIEEIERIIKVDLLGTLYGAKAALPYLRRDGGGTIINVSSVLGVRGVPLQSVYSAAKHAVKGFTESLRMEMEKHHPEIYVTLILPTSINTPFFRHARSKTGAHPRPIPPVYPPEEVARAIVFAARHPRRDIFVGGAGKMFDVAERLSPEMTDRLLMHQNKVFDEQKADRPPHAQDNLFDSIRETGSVEGEWGDLTRSSAGYTRVFEFYPALKPLVFGAAALGALALVKLISDQLHENDRRFPRSLHPSRVLERIR